MKKFRLYLSDLIRGILAMSILLLSNLRKVETTWVFPLSALTCWVLISWLLFPIMRRRFSKLYIKNDGSMSSYKTNALDAHHQDIQQNHKNRRWTSNGVTVNPWEYNFGNTQSTDDILNPLYIFCEHLFVSVLLIMFGPFILIIYGVVNKLKKNNFFGN